MNKGMRNSGFEGPELNLQRQLVTAKSQPPQSSGSRFCIIQMYYTNS